MELRCVSSSVSVSSVMSSTAGVVCAEESSVVFEVSSGVLSSAVSLILSAALLETSSAFLLPPAEHPGRAASMDIDNAAAVKRILFFLYNFCIFILPSHFV